MWLLFEFYLSTDIDNIKAMAKYNGVDEDEAPDYEF